MAQITNWLRRLESPFHCADDINVKLTDRTLLIPSLPNHKQCPIHYLRKCILLVLESRGTLAYQALVVLYASGLVFTVSYSQEQLLPIHPESTLGNNGLVIIRFRF